MIFEFRRTANQGIRVRIAREPRPDAEVRLAAALEALHWAHASLDHLNMYTDVLAAKQAAGQVNRAVREAGVNG